MLPILEKTTENLKKAELMGMKNDTDVNGNSSL